MPPDGFEAEFKRALIEGHANPRPVAFRGPEELFAEAMAQIPAQPCDWDAFRKHMPESPPTDFDNSDWTLVRRMRREGRKDRD